MKKPVMVIDITRCTACYCCFAACKDEYWGNDYPPYTAAQPRYGQFWMNLVKNERGKYPHVRVAYMPVPCMQCDNPPCMKAARNEAVYQTSSGITIIDPVRAKGQKELLDGKACPYGAIYWNEEKDLPQKCSFCLHRLEEGKVPRCVQACPAECIKFGDLDDPESEVSRLVKAAGAEVFHPEWGTQPKVYYIGLERITRHFISGTVIFGETDDCASGIKVNIESPDGSIMSTVTNAFGDFTVDGLTQGTYSVKIQSAGYEARLLKVDLVDSQHLGEIVLPEI